MIIYPPNPIPAEGNIIFLAGSIEQDLAENWQENLIKHIDDSDVVILNPRSKDPNINWRDEVEDPLFLEQVEWVLKGQERADLLVMYFDPKTQSPISLLELGLFAQTKKMLVCCPKGYFKKGNVDIVCRRYHIPQVENFHELISRIKEHSF